MSKELPSPHIAALGLGGDSVDLRPWNEPWQGSQDSTALPASVIYSVRTWSSPGLYDPGGELGLPRLVKVSSGANILWVLGVICVYNQQWLLGTCPSCRIISSHLSANVYMGSPECQFGFRLLKCCVWELYKLAGSESLISRGKGTWGSFWGSGPRVGTRVYVSSCGKDSADLEGGWLPWAPESYTNWSKLFVSLSCIVSEGGASS